MHARVSTITGAAAVDQGIAYLREEAVPALQQQKGFRGLSASADRATGHVTVLSVWDTEADLDASESSAEKARTDALKVMGGHVSVERFEQAVWDTGSAAPGPGAKLHIRPTTMAPDRIDENLEFFRNTVVPQMKATPGFLGVRYLINRRTGDGRVGTLWADTEALSASLALAEERRAMARERGIEFGEDRTLEVLFAVM